MEKKNQYLLKAKVSQNSNSFFNWTMSDCLHVFPETAVGNFYEREGAAGPIRQTCIHLFVTVAGLLTIENDSLEEAGMDLLVQRKQRLTRAYK